MLENKVSFKIIFVVLLISCINIFISSVFGFEISSPYKNYSYNLKGNLHAHSENSPDGSGTPASVAEWYKSNGFYFYSITDHDFVTPDPLVNGILTLGTSEEDTSDGSSGHMGHINVAVPITTGTRQERIDNAISQGGFTILNHPNRSRASGGYGEIHLADLNRAVGMEVYNGKGNNSSDKWDAVLSFGKKLWGFANDDAHTDSVRGNAFNVVNFNESSPSKTETIAQIKAGNFYASRGLNLKVSVSGNKIIAQSSNGSYIRWIKQFGKIIKTVQSKKSTYVPVGGEKYIRIEVLDEDKEPMAWSQPLYLRNESTEFSQNFVKNDLDDGSYKVESNSYSNNASSASVGRGSGIESINARFSNIKINRGSKISKAYLILGQNVDATNSVSFKIYGADENNSSRIDNSLEWLARPKTQTQLAWNNLSDFTIRDWETSPNIKNIVQEIVNRKGWKSGNSIQLFVTDNGSSEGQNRDFMMREHGTYPITGAARLIIYSDRYRPKTYASIRHRSIIGEKGYARARIYWKVLDPYSGGKAKVTILVKKKISSSRYKLVKKISYKSTLIGKTRIYTLYVSSSGIYKFYIYAQDQAGNVQRNIASNYLIVK